MFAAGIFLRVPAKFGGVSDSGALLLNILWKPWKRVALLDPLALASYRRPAARPANAPPFQCSVQKREPIFRIVVVTSAVPENLMGIEFEDFSLTLTPGRGAEEATWEPFKSRSHQTDTSS
jgi:hypothetical protein